jgi:hypothetical protein
MHSEPEPQFLAYEPAAAAAEIRAGPNFMSIPCQSNLDLYLAHTRKLFSYLLPLAFVHVSR